MPLFALETPKQTNHYVRVSGHPSLLPEMEQPIQRGQRHFLSLQTAAETNHDVAHEFLELFPFLFVR